MISEVDVKDWDFDQLRESLFIVSDAETWGAEEYSAYNQLHTFIDDISEMLKAHKPKVAALFKPVKHQNGIPKGEVFVYAAGSCVGRAKGMK